VTTDSTTVRVGLVVPSSNVTMEIEIPEMMRPAAPRSMSFHSSRMAMRQVSAEELRAMDGQALRCVDELADARVAAIAYACLVAVMVQGAGAHREIEGRLRDRLGERGSSAEIVSSAGALIATLRRLGAERIAIVAPYMKPLTQTVVDYLEGEGFSVVSSQSLEVADNYDVGCIAGGRVLDALDQLTLTGVDALVLSACVQMPSLSLVQSVEDSLGVPVVTAGTATAGALLDALGLDTGGVPGAAAGAWSNRPAVPGSRRSP